MPADALKYIQGWAKLNPDFTIIEWNEDNFDVGCCRYVREAYQSKKYAFVSDYARGKALYVNGGVYLDTDVELLKPLGSLLGAKAFFGFEEAHMIGSGVIGAVPGLDLFDEYLRQYDSRVFVKTNGVYDLTTNILLLNELLRKRGLVNNGERQCLSGGFVCYPKEYFSPLDYINLKDSRNQNTIAVHHYQHSWSSPSHRAKKKTKELFVQLFGSEKLKLLREFCRQFSLNKKQ